MKRLLFIPLFIFSCVTTFSQTGFRLHDKLGIRLGMGEDTVYFYAASREYGADAFYYAKGYALDASKPIYKDFGARWSLRFEFKEAKLNEIRLHASVNEMYVLLTMKKIHDHLAKFGYFMTENLEDIYNRIITSQGYRKKIKPSWKVEETYISPDKKTMVIVNGDKYDGYISISIRRPPEYLNFEETTQNQRK